MSEIDNRVWASIGLGNVLRKVDERMWDAVRNDGKHVAVMIDGETIAEFIRDEGHILALIDGQAVAKYPA